jgi:predicted transcriptional regulator
MYLLKVGFTLLRARDQRRFLQRSRIDIIACVLENSDNSSRKTRLIYRCNLSLSQFNMYADCLIEGELLKKYLTQNGTEIFETTEKGKKFLNDYEKIRKILEKMRLQPKEIMAMKSQTT